MPVKFYPDPFRFAGVIIAKSRFWAITYIRCHAYAWQRTTRPHSVGYIGPTPATPHWNWW